MRSNTRSAAGDAKQPLEYISQNSPLNMKYPPMLRLLACLLVLIMLAGCTSSSHRTDSGDDRPRLVTTIAPVADLVRRFAGERIAVQVLLPEGNTPEMYEPTPQDLVSLSEARGYLYVGDLGFERAWVGRIQSLYPHVRLYRLDVGGNELKHCSEPNDGHVHDPHYWMSFSGMEVMARNVLHALVELTPEHRAQYEQAHRDFVQELERSRMRYTGAPHRGFVIYHPSLTYYASERGLEQLVIEHDGKEPTPRQLEQLMHRARAMGVRRVFVQREFSPRLTEAIAQDLGAETTMIDPLSADWLGQLLRIDSLMHH